MDKRSSKKPEDRKRLITFLEDSGLNQAMLGVQSTFERTGVIPERRFPPSEAHLSLTIKRWENMTTELVYRIDALVNREGQIKVIVNDRLVFTEETLPKPPHLQMMLVEQKNDPIVKQLR